MRERDKRLSDYGVPAGKASRLYEICRDPRYTNLLKDCVEQSVPEINRKAVFMALYARYGYGKIMRTGIPLCCVKNDFYALKRKAAAAFYKALERCGYWKDGDRND